MLPNAATPTQKGRRIKTATATAPGCWQVSQRLSGFILLRDCLRYQAAKQSQEKKFQKP